MIHPDPRERTSAPALARSQVLEDNRGALPAAKLGKIEATLERKLTNVQQAQSPQRDLHYGNPAVSVGQTESRSTKHVVGGIQSAKSSGFIYGPSSSQELTQTSQIYNINPPERYGSPNLPLTK